VSKSIAEQISEHRAEIIEIPSGPKRGIIQGTIGEKSEEWWKQWRRKITEGTVGVQDDMDNTLVDEEEDKTMSEELRLLVKVRLFITG
jgi:hypothetical protein